MRPPFYYGVFMIGTIAKFIEFTTARGLIIDQADAGVMLQKASDYLNRQKWSGDKASNRQPDSWPRTGFVWGDTPLIDENGAWVDIPEGDDDGTFSGTPYTIHQAAYQLGLAVAQGVDLSPAMGGKQTISETVGPISVTYDKDTIGLGPQVDWILGDVAEWLSEDLYTGGTFEIFRG